MFAGIDFPSHFDKDNFVERRSIGNRYDPESLISGEELAQGYTYKNSSRRWRNQEHYQQAIDGELTTIQILEDAPRRFRTIADEYIATGIVDDPNSLLSEDVI